MNKSRKMTLAAAALVTGAILYVRRMRKHTAPPITGQAIKKTRHLNPAFSKIKDRHRNVEN